MKRFQFRLETVLLLRREKERRGQQRHLEALRIRDLAAGRLHAVQTTRERCADEQRALQVRRATVGELQSAQDYALWLREQEVRFQAELGRAEEGVTRARQALAILRRNREALEKHRERQRVTHGRQVQLAEQKFLDEMALQAGVENTLVYNPQSA